MEKVLKHRRREDDREVCRESLCENLSENLKITDPIAA